MRLKEREAFYRSAGIRLIIVAMAFLAMILALFTVLTKFGH